MNSAVLNSRQRNQGENEYPELLNVGSCSPHIYCGALKAGEDASGSNLSKSSKSMVNAKSFV